MMARSPRRPQAPKRTYWDRRDVHAWDLLEGDMVWICGEWREVLDVARNIEEATQCASAASEVERGWAADSVNPLRLRSLLTYEKAWATRADGLGVGDAGVALGGGSCTEEFVVLRLLDLSHGEIDEHWLVLGRSDLVTIQVPEETK